jgi:tetraacyldisaccharide 4'-kinase
MLQLLGKVYGAFADLRNSLYDRDLFRSHSLGTRTISIGNITTGGTGKTPLVAYVAEILADAGETVCILTRGYGRENERQRVLVSDRTNVLVDARKGGDEPVELARNLLGKAIVVADADRVSAAAWAKKEFGVTTFILDDAFQHRRAKRDLDIVCVDATNPSGKMIPAGPLREPLLNLARADAIVMTRCDMVDAPAGLVSWAAGLSPNAKIFSSHSEIRSLINLGGFLGSVGTEPVLDPDTPSLVFCGLGNPEAFFTSVRKAGYRVEAARAFLDHHVYTQSDIADLEHTAGKCGATALLTTAKDAVKLAGLKFNLQCYVAQAEIKMDDPAGFRDLVLSV